MAWSRRSRILAPTLAALSLAVAVCLGEPMRQSFLEFGATPSSITMALRTFYEVPVFLASAVVVEIDEWGTGQMWVALLFPLVLLQNLMLWLIVRLALGRHAAR